MSPIVKKKITHRRDNNKVYSRTQGEYDFLKNWSLIKKWAIVNYELKSTADLEMILFLYSEKLFTRTQFADYSKFMSWDKERFNRLLNSNWIYIWRHRNHQETHLYEVSYKGKKMVNSIYKKLLGLEPIPESKRRNKVFLKTAPFSHKTLAIAIKKHNKELKERKQRPSPELR
jgi:hypothetical protein